MKKNPIKRDLPWPLFAGINLALLAAALVLGMLSFFASLEIVMAIGAQLIWQSMGATTQGNYAFALLRNAWLILGGIVLLVIFIYCINHYFKRWREARAQRLYIVLLAVEALIILAAQALTAV